MANKKVLPDKCPICGSKMEKGFLVSRTSYWSTKPRKNILAYGPWHVFSEEAEVIAKEQLSSLANVEAHRCKNCKLVIFRYDKQIT
jgi:hypothetical protein